MLIDYDVLLKEILLMENNRIAIGTRDISKRALYGTQIGLLITALIFLSDLIIYLLRRSTVSFVFLIITSVLLGLSLIGLLFTYSSYRSNKKNGKRPLLEYDQDKDVFVIYDLSLNKEVEIPNGKLLEIHFPTSEVGSVNINYTNEKGKKEFASIGIGRRYEESDVIKLINQYSKVKL